MTRQFDYNAVETVINVVLNWLLHLLGQTSPEAGCVLFKRQFKFDRKVMTAKELWEDWYEPGLFKLDDSEASRKAQLECRQHINFGFMFINLPYPLREKR